jgi:hypothetical protein
MVAAGRECSRCILRINTSPCIHSQNLALMSMGCNVMAMLIVYVSIQYMTVNNNMQTM